MRVIELGAAVCVGAIVVAAASPVSAKPIEQEHYSFQESDTFTDTECGEPITIDYAAEFSGLFKLKSGRHGDPTPYLFDNYSGVETYTNVANGKTATLRHKACSRTCASSTWRARCTGSPPSRRADPLSR